MIAKNKPTLFIISGPGGAGKTTILSQLFKKDWAKKKLIRVITATSREPRPGEKDKKDYFFFTKKEFLKRKAQGFFLETQPVADNFYGTPGFFWEKAKKAGKDLILCIDVKGGIYLQKNFTHGRIVTIFITVAKINELFSRMKKRKEQAQVIKKRVSLAKKELTYQSLYDYVIVNDKLDNAVNALEMILKAQQYRRR